MTTLLAFLFTIAVLIVIHELGHYAVARMARVKVLRFSVGFGSVIAQKKDRHGTEWVLAAIPLGGYVKMLDEREAPIAATELDQAFNRKSLRARAAIVAAGPLANFLLAIVLFWALFMVGIPVSKPVLGTPPDNSPAALAGIQSGETLRQINGESVQSWQDAHWLILKSVLRGDNLELETIDADNRKAFHQITVGAVDEVMERSPLRELGLLPALPPLPPVLGQLTPDGSANRAGLQVGDRIVRVNGQPIALWDELVRHIRMAPGQTMTLEIDRGETRLEMNVVPDRVEEGETTIGRIGAAPFMDPAILEPLQDVARYSPIAAMQRALDRTWDLSVFSLEMLGRMIIGEASLKNLSGPITIADYAGQSAESGWYSFIAFLALVSISLGVLNLLPVPLLDGGHLLYYLAEFVTGRPVSEHVQEWGQKIGITLLGLLMFFAFYNDLQRLFAG